MALHILFTWLALSLPLLLLLLLSVKNFNNKKKNLPPGPPSLPIIGNFHQLGSLPHQSLRKLSRQYGPVMLIHLGGAPTIVISSPEAAREVLKTHDLDSCSRPQLAGPKRLSYDSLDMAFVEYGDYWRELRTLCVLELFSMKRVQSFRYIREEEVGSMIESIAKSAESGTPVNMSEKFMALTANFTCRVAFGKPFQGTELEDKGFMDMVHEGVAMLGSFSASDYFPRFGWIVDRFTGLHSRLEKSFHNLDDLYQKVIEEHRNANKSNEGKEDIVNLLLKMEKDQTELAGVRLKEDNIKAILMNIFLGGVDTGAVVMDWTMVELARNPRVMRKAREEIRSCVGNKKWVVEEDLSELKYLKLVLKEVMRLHPPAVLLIPRETNWPLQAIWLRCRPEELCLRECVGHGTGPRTVGASGGVCAGEVQGQSNRLQGESFRADTIWGRAEAMPRDVDGHGDDRAGACQCLALLRLGIAGGNDRGRCENGRGGWPISVQESTSHSVADEGIA